ncbi:MAG TPA: NeuD/PglB/VioB family sugar acetyltransferase [Gaiellaceae bacterium]|nr:NeuD/PglB/VioB family sugar acetyltransferase [Gaiellaceae bacterium]
MTRHAAGGCVVLGGGGHARVLIDLMREAGLGEPHGVLDADPSRWGGELDGVAILGGDELLPQLRAQGVSSFAVGLGSVGDSGPRRRLFSLALGHGLEPMMLRHPTAVCSAGATVGPGCQLLPAAIVNAGASLGANVIVNSGAIVEHDCVVGDHVHVASGARLASSVHVGTGAHVGIGAVVLQCISIGEAAVVGAGAVVVRDVPPATTVVGAPAKPL